MVSFNLSCKSYSAVCQFLKNKSDFRFPFNHCYLSRWLSVKGQPLTYQQVHGVIPSEQVWTGPAPALPGPFPVDWETNTTENITFPQTTYADGNENTELSLLGWALWDGGSII